MKCTDSSSKTQRKKTTNKRKIRNRWVKILSVILMVQCILATGIYVKENQKPETLVKDYEVSNYKKTLYQGHLVAEKLCTSSDDIPLSVKSSDTSSDSVPENASAVGNPLGFEPESVHAVGLFDIKDATTDCAYNIHKKLYPASTTKILTALVALENGNLTDTVTVSAEADSANFAADEQTCGIKAGDQLTLEDLLNGLLLYSGNDNAVAIADHIAGNTKKFAEMMNAEAQKLMATNSHFVNPSGLHDDNHYTTAYDLYLIFNECIKHEEFVKIINSSSYTAQVKFQDSAYFLKKQMLNLLVGIVVMVFVSKIDYRILLKRLPGLHVHLVTVLYFCAVLLQLSVYFVGREFNGAKRWLVIGPVSIQPAEISKIAVLLITASFINNAPAMVSHIKGAIRILLAAAVLIVLVGKENLSSAIVMMGIVFIMCFVAARYKRMYIISMLIVAGLVWMFITFGDSFRMQRIENRSWTEYAETRIYPGTA